MDFPDRKRAAVPARFASLYSLSVLLFFLMVCGSVANAQSAALGGVVMDPSSAMVRDAQVTVTNQRTSVALHTKTNGSGLYSVPFIQPGLYTLAVEAPGFKRYERTGITIETAQTIAIDVRLQLGETSQSVTVDGSGAQLNMTDATVNTVINRQFVENMPLSGRSFQPLLTLIPGVNQVPIPQGTGNGYSGEFTVNGQRSEANYFTVDGVGVNTGIYTSNSVGSGTGFAGTTLQETALGTTQSLISVDALEEFNAQTSSYSAEYGRTPGGQFSLSSRAGTNSFHGSVYDYFRNGATSANAWFNNYYDQPRLEEHQNDFGGTLGGPIIVPGLYNGHDKSFFFFSYEGLRLRNPVAADLTAVPSVALREAAAPGIKALIEGFPLPLANAADLGAGMSAFTSGYVSPGSLDTLSLRLDEHFGEHLLLFGRMSYSPSSVLTRSSYNLANPSNLYGTVGSVTLGATATLSAQASNDLRFNFTRNKQKNVSYIDDFGGATPYSNSVLPGLSNSDGAGLYLLTTALDPFTNTVNSRSRQRQINLVDVFRIIKDKHSLSFGFDYRGLFNSQSVYSNWEYAFAFSEQSITSGSLDGSVLKKFGAAPHPVYQNYSAFAQDNWKATSRLSISMGLRWEVNPPPTDSRGNNPYTVDQVTNLATTQLAPEGTPLWKTTYGNFAPRLGVAWQAHQQPGHETIVRGGGGVFFDLGTTNGSNGYAGPGFISTTSISSGPFPFSAQDVQNAPAPNANPPYTAGVTAYNPHYQLPYTWQWNLAVEQALGTRQSMTLTYIGSAGKRLPAAKFLYPDLFNNPYFSEGYGLQLGTNDASSSYSALQVQYQRTLANGLQALVNYTWSHSLDDTSTNSIANELEHASSDFDVRNAFNAAITYDIPSIHSNRIIDAAVNHWSFDTRFTARSAVPVDIVSNQGNDVATGMALNYHPNRVAGQPLYIHDSSVPGGRVINAAAFSTPTDANGNPLPIEGDVSRNYARGFDAIQSDLAIRREFPIREGMGVQFRAEAFNMLNHPIFGAIYNQLNGSPDSTSGATLFGQAYQTLNTTLGGLNALYQSGGPRSMQFTVRLHF